MVLKTKIKDTAKLIVEIIEILIIIFALSWFMKMYVVGFSSVDGNGMLPTLGNNDQIFVLKFIDDPDSLQRGDIVVLKDINSNQRVKRLIGRPKDEIEIRNGFTYVNGKPLYEPYALTPLTLKMEPLIIPQNQVFVLNDNRSEANDSRELGSIPIDNLEGKAIFCYWPWSRIKGL